MKRNNDEIKTPGFFVFLDWHETISELKDDEAGILLKNMFNYSLELPLLETNAVVKAICKMVVFKTIEINKQKYIEKCETNRVNGKKGGRPAGSKKINQEQPNGLIKNPEKPKDRDIEKDRDKERDRNKVNEEIYKMKKIVDIDLKKINNNVDSNFCMRVKELVRILSWDRFELLVFHTKESEIENLLSKFDKTGCLYGINDIRASYALFLDKLIK